jgi:hypothetical protein
MTRGEAPHRLPRRLPRRLPQSMQMTPTIVSTSKLAPLIFLQCLRLRALVVRA